MNFVSIAFFVFFVIVLGLQLVLKKSWMRQAVLLIASYVFYGWWDWRFCFLMLGLTVVAFFTALGLEKRPGDKKIVAAGVIVPLAVLFFFKYMNFFVDSFCGAFGITAPGALAIILPVGISFYTFQSLSYTIDAWRGKVEISHDFMKFALYIAFFPQLVAGPIVKAADFLPQLDEERRLTKRGLADGLSIFFWGLLKKAVLADQLSPFVDAVFAAPNAYASVSVALAVLAYAMQIYFDFSGYSDMAIGCAKCMGYDLAKNFDLPYISKNVSEFWKRWHISLSSWLQQYLYISLGGNRKGRTRTYVNLMLTMLLGGLWHGAGVNFIIWGGLHGAALCVHKVWHRWRPNYANRFTKAMCVIFTFIFVCLCWVPFRASDFATSAAIYGKLFIWSGGITQLFTWALAVPVLTGLATLWCAHFHRDERGSIHGEMPIFNLNTFSGVLLFTLLIGICLILMYTGDNPFIYFQF